MTKRSSSCSRRLWVSMGVLHGIEPRHTEWWKFETLMGHMEYNESGVFGDGSCIDYEDAHVAFRGALLETNLFDISDRDAIRARILEAVAANVPPGARSRCGTRPGVLRHRGARGRGIAPAGVRGGARRAT